VPTDRARGAVTIRAPLEQVLAALRDVVAQPQWAPRIAAAELLEEYEDGTPALASFELASSVGTDTFTLQFEHQPDAMSWVLVSSRIQKGQRGEYRLRDLGGGRTEVSLDLEVEHSMTAPGFLRRKVIGGFVDGLLAGLRGYFEGG
jgi:uncharacterized membrane protein